MIAFVEGSMERQFLNANMNYVHVVPVQNGISWNLERMCLQISTAYQALNRNCDVIVWIDREGRSETSHEIGDQIRDALISCGADPLAIHLLINDRMVENVILADENAIRDEFGDPNYIYSFEGHSGKSILKAMFGSIDINYKETNHGVKLLKKIRISRSSQKSPTTARFLSTFTQDCWWI